MSQRQKYGWQQLQKQKHSEITPIAKDYRRDQNKKEIMQHLKISKEMRKQANSAPAQVAVIALDSNLNGKLLFEYLMSNIPNIKQSQFLNDIFENSQSVYKLPSNFMLSPLYLDVTNEKSLDSLFQTDFVIFLTTSQTVLEHAVLEFLDQIIQLRLVNVQQLVWQFDQFEVLELQMNGVVKSSNKQTVKESSYFAPNAIYQLINLNTGMINLQQFDKINLALDPRPSYLSNRAGMRIMAAKQLDDETFQVAGFVRGRFDSRGAPFITNIGDFIILKHIEIGQYRFEQNSVDMKEIELREPFERSRTIASEQAFQKFEEEQQKFADLLLDQEQQRLDQQTTEQDDTTIDIVDQTETDMEMTDLNPIQQDFDFKMAQNKTTLKEKIDYSDELDIHPQTTMIKLLQGFAGLKSLRNSVFPFDTPRTADFHQFYHLKQPKQIELFMKKRLQKESQFGRVVEEYQDLNFVILTLGIDIQGYSDYIAKQQTIGKQTFNGSPIVEFYDKMPNFVQCQTNIGQICQQVIGQSLIVLHEHELKYGLAQIKIMNFDKNPAFKDQQDGLVYDQHSQFVFRIGFRKVFGIPTPYQQISDTRGKLVRCYTNSNCCELGICMQIPCQFYINASSLPPVLIYAAKQSTINIEGCSNYEMQGNGRISMFSSYVQILERIILTGWPYKINKRKSIVRYMFFNANDVEYFQNQMLSTKNGLHGRILQPLSEKGYFKAIFDGQLTSGDCIEFKAYRPLNGTGAGFGLSVSLEMMVELNATQEMLALLSSMGRNVESMIRDQPLQ